MSLTSRLAGSAVLSCLTSFACADTVLPDLKDLRLRGYVGDRLNGCIEHHVKATDGLYLTDLFHWKTETELWQSEFWGKWMHAAVPLVRYSGSAELEERIRRSVGNLLSAQLSDGYLGNYCEKSRYGIGWDVWGSKYTMLGLMFHYDLTGDAAALEAAKRQCDHLMGVFGPGKRELRQSGQLCGLPSCSVLEAVVWLYNRTKEPRYLSFARDIAAQLNAADGLRLVDDALAGVSVADRTPKASKNEGRNAGHKAYEMMSCYQGLVELGLATGERKYVEAAVAAAKDIAATEVNICGGASSIEHWYRGATNQVRPFSREQETCVLTTWMRLCAKLLQVTGDPFFADQLERTFYNAYLAALNRDNSFFETYTPLAGYRSRGQYHCRMHTNCCNANGPRGFVSFLESFLQTDGSAAVFNLYASSTASVNLPATGEKVTFETFTLYPAENRVEIFNRTEKPLRFTLKLRIPAWSAKTAVRLNGKPVEDVRAGAYLVLDRTWQPGDGITLDFDFRTVAHVVENHVAFTRGPVTLARDSRFHDGDIGEVVRYNCSQMAGDLPFEGALREGLEVEATPVRAPDPALWMACSIRLPMGVHRENPENRRPQNVLFCDFASAGNTWSPSDTYRVWLPIELFYGLNVK